MSKRTYHKVPKSFAEQLQQLKDRKLTVNDDAKAIAYLSHISYYRLSAYFLPYQQTKNWFDDGTTFKQIIDTYSFDRELRLLVFDCIERIEVAIRTQFIYCMATHYNDSHWQDNKQLFIKPFYNKIGNLVDPYFDLHYTVFTSWLHSLTYVRNICAHHSRLWNKDLAVEPTRLLKPVGNWVSEDFNNNNKRVFYFLCLLKYFLKRVNPNNHLKEKTTALFNKYPSVPIKYISIPSDGNDNLLDWQNEPLWEQ